MKAGIKALICPAFVMPPFKAENADKFGIAIGDYAMLWNIVNYPAGVLPVTEVKEGED